MFIDEGVDGARAFDMLAYLAAVEAEALVADVNPQRQEVVAAGVLEDELVEIAQLRYEAAQLVVVLRRGGRGGDVGGLALGVLARGGAAHYAVELGAAVAGGDGDGAVPGGAQRVEDVIDQGGEVLQGVDRRRVVDAARRRRLRAVKLLDSEVLHDCVNCEW